MWMKLKLTTERKSCSSIILIVAVYVNCERRLEIIIL